MKKLKWMLIAVLVIVSAFSLTSCSACDKGNGDKDPSSDDSGNNSSTVIDSIFDDSDKVLYVLSEDYKLSSKDVEATGGTSNQVVFNKAVSFDLANKTLDLNGYTLKIASDAVDCLVKFNTGKIVNGTLDISVPNGDIEFTGTELASNVAYELEAASSTIRFANVKCLGSGTVKSKTNIEVEYSEIGDMALSGNGTLNAGEGTSFAKISIGDNASGAKVNISKNSTVRDVAVGAKAKINIAGAVTKVTVNENAVSANEIEVKVTDTATIDKVEIKAPAKVEVQGEVKSVEIAETAKSDTANAEVKVSETASVHQIEVQAKTELEIKGAIGNMVVGDKATGTTVNVASEDATVGRVVINATETKIEGEASTTIDKIVVSKDVETQVEIPSDIVTEVVEDITTIIRKHVYVVEEVVESTCSLNGQIKYVCNEDGCNDSYVVKTEKKPHDYTCEVTLLPTQLTTGERTYICDNCGHTYIEVIDALPIESESVYALIKQLIGDGNYSMTLKDGAGVTVYEELSDYSKYDAVKTFYVIDVCEAILNVKDGEPKGTIAFKIGSANVLYDGTTDIKELTYNPNDYYVIAGFRLYLNEGEIFVEMIDGEDGDSLSYLTVDDLIQQSLQAIFGVGFTNDVVIDMIEAFKFADGVIREYEPFFESIKAELEVNIDFATIVGILGDELFEKVEDENGNFVYTLTTAELKALIETIDGASIADLIDNAYGEGSFEQLLTTVKELPDMTVEEVANFALMLEENYDFDVDYTIELLENAIYALGGVEIDLAKEIEDRYSMTILDVIRESSEDEVTNVQLREQFNSMLAQVEEMAKTLTIDDVFNMIVTYMAENGPTTSNPGDDFVEDKPELLGDVDGEVTEETLSLIAMLNNLVSMIDETSTIAFVTDANGKLTTIYAEVEEVGLVSYDLTEGIYEVVAGYGPYTLVVVSNPTDDVYNVTVFNGEDILYSGDLSLNGEHTLSAIIKAADQILADIILDLEWDDLNKLVAGNAEVIVMDYSATINADTVNGSASIIIEQAESEIGKVVVSTDENGEVNAKVVFGGETLAIVDLVKDENSFTALFDLTIMDTAVTVEIVLERIDENTKKLILDIAPFVDGKQRGILVELISAVTVEDETTVANLDVNVTGNNISDYLPGETIIVDGELTYTMVKDEGKVQQVIVGIDCDKFFISEQYKNNELSAGDQPVYSTSYADFNFEVTIDYNSNKVVDGEKFEDIAQNVSKLAGLSFEDSYSGYSYTYEKTGESEYITLAYREEHNDYFEYGIAKVPAKNGLPQFGSLLVYEDCGDWVEIIYQYYTTFEVTTSYGDHGNMAIPFTISTYYNTKTGEFASDTHHDISYSGKLIGSRCSDGILVTKTCANCDFKKSFVTNDHYNVPVNEQTLTTICGESIYCIDECVGCKNGYIVSEDYCHQFFENEYSEATLAEIQSLVNGVTAITSAHKTTYVCSHCLLKKVEYSWYSQVDGECRKHEYIVCEFVEGNGYPTQKVEIYKHVKGHDYQSAYNNIIEVPTNVISDLTVLLGANHFSNATAWVETVACPLCNHVSHVTYNVSNTDNSATISYYYNLDGEVEEKYVSVGTLSCQFATELVGEYIEGEIRNAWYYIYADSNNIIYLKDLHVEVTNNDTVDYEYRHYTDQTPSTRVYFYDYSDCLRYSYLYEGEDLIDEDVNEAHTSGIEVSGPCCTEGEIVNACYSCGKIMSSKEGDHSYGMYPAELGSYISNDGLDEIEALSIHTSWGVCNLCEKICDAVVQLDGDWTLTQDVFIYADSLYLVLNGYTIDLNGYNLILYGFAGSEVCVNSGTITDSSDNPGYFVAFSDNVNGNIDYTDLTLYVEYFISDADNLNTIEQSFYAEKGVELSGFESIA